MGEANGQSTKSVNGVRKKRPMNVLPKKKMIIRSNMDTALGCHTLPVAGTVRGPCGVVRIGKKKDEAARRARRRRNG